MSSSNKFITLAPLLCVWVPPGAQLIYLVIWLASRGCKNGGVVRATRTELEGCNRIL
ncbi:hypothetical protein BDZ94DRAFT_1271193, partial [Collybia nuda]